MRFFAALSSFVFTFFAYHVVSLTVSEELLLKFHPSVLIFRTETPVLANKVPLYRLTGFTKNDFWGLKLGVIFTLKKKEGATTSFPGSLILSPGASEAPGVKMRDPGNEVETVSHKGIKKVCYNKMFCLSVSYSLEAFEVY